MAFASLGGVTQQRLLEARTDDVLALVDYSPLAEGALGSHLVRVFELLGSSASAALLSGLGDGFEAHERQASGWNKLVHRLLAAIKWRIREQAHAHARE